MQEFQYTIQDENGIHARPAGLLVRKAQSYQSSATMIHEGKSADMKRLFALLGLNIKQGNTVTVQLSGEDEAAAAQGLSEFFGENL
ncbi:HPr family phosphocarrier protein [Caproicibacter sp.]|uniref:HPr family phosphocarrier protein n=1 Tax=Caproicibacter sp. TaxID=2814884 RepID=UPI003989A1D9